MVPPAPKRILYCEGNTDGTIGGSYYSLLFLVSGLDKSRYSPIVVFYSDNFVAQQMRDRGIDVRILDFPETRKPTGRLRQLWAEWRLSRRHAKLLKQENVALVHVNNSIGHSYEWLLAARECQIPCVCHERSLESRFSRKTHYFAPRFSRIIAISESVRDNILAQGMGTDNMTLVYNGIDPDVVVPKKSSGEVRAEWNIPASAPVIGIIGNVAAWKGQASVVDAVALLRKQFPELVCFIVGGVPNDEIEFAAGLNAQIERLGIKDAIRLTGYQKHPADFMNACDVVLHASIEPEPFGRVIVEAMSLSKPVVGSRAGGVVEIIEDGTSGLLFPPGDAQQLASCVTRILSDAAFAQSLGAAARRRVFSHFHIDRNVERTMEVYRDVLGG
jgi:glycosyltransferase involved in cell wall biosynthesis